MKISRAFLKASLSSVIAFLSPVSWCAAISLPSYNVDVTHTTASGISSGAYMATQFSVAYSTLVTGVGIVAGGPYDCANNSLSSALSACMQGGTSANASISLADARSAAASIDATSNLARQKVHIFHGYNDGSVRLAVTSAAYDFYSHYNAAGNIMFKTNLGTGHTLPTVSTGNACNLTGSPYVGNCNYDWAGLMLQHLLGKLAPATMGAPSGQLLEFAQSEFVSGDPAQAGLSAKGYAYVPSACSGGASCTVHVSFHGCLQNVETVGNAYTTGTGLNAYADSNHIIVLYPQTTATSTTPYNPDGCWDWWGYTNSHYAERNGVQIQAVHNMLLRLAGAVRPLVPPGGGFGAPTNLVAADATDTRIGLFWSPVTNAVGYKVYRATTAASPFVLINGGALAGASRVDSGLHANTNYYYKVTAVDASGAESSASNIVSLHTAAVPPACDPWFSDNYSHTLAGRAYALYGLTYALGSNDSMGLWDIYVNSLLRKVGANYFLGPCQ